MKKRYDVYYTVQIRETLNHYRTYRHATKKTNKANGCYNDIQLGKNLKLKDALELIAKYDYPDGFFSIRYNDNELCFGSRHGNHIDLINSRDFKTSYIYNIANPDSLHPVIEM